MQLTPRWQNNFLFLLYCLYFSFTYIWCSYYYFQKRCYTKETIRGIEFLHWLKVLFFFMIGWDDWINKRVNYLSCIEGKGRVDRNLMYYTKCRTICSSNVKSPFAFPLFCQKCSKIYHLFFNFYWKHSISIGNIQIQLETLHLNWNHCISIGNIQ